MALLFFALVACNKETMPENGLEENPVKVTITTAPELMAEGTKTVISQDPENEKLYIPSWLGNEKMYVWVDNVPSTSDNVNQNEMEFLSNGTEGRTASFTGNLNLSEGDHMIYGFATSSDGYAAKSYEYGIGFDIPQTQHPTLTSFDSDADLLIARPQSVNIAAGQSELSIENAQFSRPFAVLKVVLKDGSSKGIKGVAAVKSLTLTPAGSDYLSGRAAIDVKNGSSIVKFNKLSNTNVKAEYADESFIIDDENAAWLVVNPLTFGSPVTLTVEAGKYSANKTLDVTGLELKRGDVTVFYVTLTDDDVTVVESGLALPYINDFDNYEDNDDIKQDFDVNGYAGKEGNSTIRLASGSQNGTITTIQALDLSQPFTVKVFGTGYTSDERTLEISAGSQTRTVTFETDKNTATEFDECQYAHFEALTNTEKISFTATKGVRIILDRIEIVSGEWTPSAEITSVETVKAAADETSAVLSGSYTALFLGESDVVKYGFEWGIDVSDMASVEASGAVDGNFSYRLDDLQSGTEYTFRAWAQLNDGEKIYGGEMKFTASVPVGIDPNFSLTSYNSIPEGWEGEIGFGSYFKMASGNYLTSPMLNMEGCTSAEVSIAIGSFGNRIGQSIIINISYDGGHTYSETYEFPAPTSADETAQTYSLQGPFTSTVVIKLTPNDSCTSSNCIRIQNYSLTAE